MAASGVRIARGVFAWSAAEPASGTFDFRFYDEYVQLLARYRIRVLPVLYGSPTFHSSAPAARFPERVQPRHNAPFGRFIALVAKRYGPRGTFWRRHRAIPYLPIRSWQVWNEPNVSFFWSPRPDPRQYVRMLRTAARAIKRVDRGAEIVSGGIPDSRHGTSFMRYLRGVYRAGGRRWIDTVALHTYSQKPSGGLRMVKRVRRLMDRRGDRRARIWVTEFGWSSGGPRHRFRVTPRGQAANVRSTLRMLWTHRRPLRLRGAIYVMWGDLPRYRSDFWGLHLGLNGRDGKPKPAAAAFRRTARRLR